MKRTVKGIACYKCGIMLSNNGDKVGQTHSLYSAELKGYIKALCPQCSTREEDAAGCDLIGSNSCAR